MTEKPKNTLLRLGIAFGAIILLSVIGLGIWRASWVTFVDNYELGFNYKVIGGSIEVFEHTGWVIRTPIINKVHTIDLRPYQVSISANERILNAKLVMFDPAGLQTFIKWHGREAGDNTAHML